MRGISRQNKSGNSPPPTLSPAATIAQIRLVDMPSCDFFSWKVLFTGVQLALLEGTVSTQGGRERIGARSCNSTLNNLSRGTAFQVWHSVENWKALLRLPRADQHQAALSNGNVYFLYSALEFHAEALSGPSLADHVSKCHSPVFPFCAVILVPSARRKTFSSLLFSVV